MGGEDPVLGAVGALGVDLSGACEASAAVEGHAKGPAKNECGRWCVVWWRGHGNSVDDQGDGALLKIHRSLVCSLRLHKASV